MPRVKKGAARSRKHKKILKSTRGQIGAASRRYRVAIEAWLRAGQYATIGRKLRKRDFRRLWITRISAACRQRGLAYSTLMHGLSRQNVTLNRKMLAEMAVADPEAFDAIVRIAQSEAPPVVEAAPPAAVDKPPAAEAKAPAKKEAAPAKKADAEELAAKKPAPAKKTAAPAKKTAAKKTAAKAAPARKKAASAAKKTTAKAAAARKKAASTAKKPAARKPKTDKSAEE